MSELVILRQDSLAKEKFSKNDVQKEVHVVAKNLPFVFDIGSINDSINFHTSRIVARLLYDSDYDADFKPVDYVKQEPMTYKSFVNTTGDRATIEVRLLVLTSQHEDSLFRVKLSVVVMDQTLEVVSEPIRVVSKPSQVHKKRRTASSTVEISSPPPTPATHGTKRSAPSSDSPTSSSSQVMEALQRLEEQQREQRKIVEQLLLNQQQQAKFSLPVNSNDEFETAFLQFINAYSKLSSAERPTKLRKALSSSPLEHTDSLVDFISVCASPEAGVSDKLTNLLGHGCTGDCAHKKDLENWDTLYSELTWSPESDQL